MLPETLIKRRGQLRLTQAELAAKMGVTVTTISRWETGSRAIPKMAETLLRFIESEPLTPEEQERFNQRARAEMEQHYQDAPSTGRVPAVADVLRVMREEECSQDEAVRKLGGTP